MADFWPLIHKVLQPMASRLAMVCPPSMVPIVGFQIHQHSVKCEFDQVNILHVLGRAMFCKWNHVASIFVICGAESNNAIWKLSAIHGIPNISRFEHKNISSFNLSICKLIRR